MQETRTRREIAADLVDELFSETHRVLITDAIAAGAERGVSKTTIERAMREAGVQTIRNGRHGGFWARPETADA